MYVIYEVLHWLEFQLTACKHCVRWLKLERLFLPPVQTQTGKANSVAS